jgi:hypothetical protein
MSTTGPCVAGKYFDLTNVRATLPLSWDLAELWNSSYICWHFHVPDLKTTLAIPWESLALKVASEINVNQRVNQ